MSKTTAKLERAATRAHAAGLTWGQWWPTVAADVQQVEPLNAERFRRLARRLLGLLVAGNADGQEPAGEPWLSDDEADAPPVLDLLRGERYRSVTGALPSDGNGLDLDPDQADAVLYPAADTGTAARANWESIGSGT